jgi:hypothetical protein
MVVAVIRGAKLPAGTLAPAQALHEGVHQAHHADHTALMVVAALVALSRQMT